MNFRRAVAGVENEFHAPVAASERSDRRDVRGELKTVRGDIIAAGQRRDDRAVVAERVNQPRDGIQVVRILLAISDERLRRTVGGLLVNFGPMNNAVSTSAPAVLMLTRPRR
jgi:hypothetical protein